MQLMLLPIGQPKEVHRLFLFQPYAKLITEYFAGIIPAKR
jgi:hypothetical protein